MCQSDPCQCFYFKFKQTGWAQVICAKSWRQQTSSHSTDNHRKVMQYAWKALGGISFEEQLYISSTLFFIDNTLINGILWCGMKLTYLALEFVLKLWKDENICLYGW